MFDTCSLCSASRDKLCVRGGLSAQILLAAVAAAPSRHPQKLPHPQLHRVRFIYLIFFNVHIHLGHAPLSKFQHGTIKETAQCSLPPLPLFPAASQRLPSSTVSPQTSTATPPIFIWTTTCEWAPPPRPASSFICWLTATAGVAFCCSPPSPHVSRRCCCWPSNRVRPRLCLSTKPCGRLKKWNMTHKYNHLHVFLIIFLRITNDNNT